MSKFFIILSSAFVFMLVAAQSSTPKPTIKVSPIQRPNGSDDNAITTINGSQLTLTMINDSGEPVIPQTCQLLGYRWGEDKAWTLQHNGNRIHVPLDLNWLHKNWPVTSQSSYLLFGRILLKAPGYATLCSEQFHWIGTNKDEVNTHTVIRFPGRPKIRVFERKNVSVTILFRRPGRRFLKLIDTLGVPIMGIKVIPKIFASNNNHCCIFQDIQQFPMVTSNASGLVAVPDGDFEYLFTFETEDWYVKNPSYCHDRLNLVVTLSARKTVVLFHCLECRPLKLIVTVGKKPAPGCRLMANSSYPSCGATSGIIATTDEKGRIIIEDFKPRKYDRIYFINKDGKTVWYANPKEACFRDLVTVAFPL